MPVLSVLDLSFSSTCRKYAVPPMGLVSMIHIACTSGKLWAHDVHGPSSAIQKCDCFLAHFMCFSRLACCVNHQQMVKCSHGISVRDNISQVGTACRMAMSNHGIQNLMCLCHSQVYSGARELCRRLRKHCNHCWSLYRAAVHHPTSCTCSDIVAQTPALVCFVSSHLMQVCLKSL